NLLSLISGSLALFEASPIPPGDGAGRDALDRVCVMTPCIVACPSRRTPCHLAVASLPTPRSLACQDARVESCGMTSSGGPWPRRILGGEPRRRVGTLPPGRGRIGCCATALSTIWATAR